MKHEVYRIRQELKRPDYSKPSLPNITGLQSHLSNNQQEDLLGLLHNNESLFKGEKVEWPNKEVEIKLVPGLKLFQEKNIGYPGLIFLQ